MASVKLIIMPQQTLNCSSSVSAAAMSNTVRINIHDSCLSLPVSPSHGWRLFMRMLCCVSSYAWSPRLAQQPGREARSESSKYELVLWILVNYHCLFAWDNDRPGLAKTASLYVRRKWALPQTLSANRRKHSIADARAAVMRSLIISLSSQIYAAVAGGLAKWVNDGYNPSYTNTW